MTSKDYTITLTVDQSPEEVFAAVTNVRGWWSEEIEGRTDALGAQFKYHYRDLHRSTQKIIELAPGSKVVWHIVDSEIHFVADKSEWNGTDVVFEITKKGGKTQLHFTHVGLSPGIECYGKCCGAWRFYVEESLQALITTGKGDPVKALETR